MLQEELIKFAACTLENAGVEYMMTGSTASNLHEAPRTTHDIDIVVCPKSGFIKSILAAFPESNYYVSEEAIKDAVKRTSMFNVLAPMTCGKIDFWILSREPFDIIRFSRRLKEDFLGQNIVVTSPEDTILSKLNWAKETRESGLHFKDALHVYELQSTTLDLAYIERWIDTLGLETLWKRLIKEARVL